MNITHFPFSAIVGQQAMKTALLLNAVDPTIGGVLIRGEKGTAKSTAARALAALLPELEAVRDCPYHCPPEQREQMHDGCRERAERGETLPREEIATPMVELPLGATEDRVAGSIHLEKTLASGRRHFEPGLLAAANRGILYVDEVNLLEDHLVDLLLDAAASGINRVEREGLCITHPARFMLVGTMNPEEGELRPQFLDRFGLAVTVQGVTDRQLRRDLIADRLAFERNPAEFQCRWAAEETFLGRQIAGARQLLGQVVNAPAAIDFAVDIALELKVRGHRADIILLKAARALAALLEKTEVTEEHIRAVAWFVLPHRLPGGMLMDGQQVDNRISAALAGRDPVAGADGLAVAADCAGDYDDYEFPGSAAAGSMLFATFKKKTSERLINLREDLCLAPLGLENGRLEHPQTGRSVQWRNTLTSGRYLRSIPLTQTGKAGTIDPVATLRAGLLRYGAGSSRRRLCMEDLRQKLYRDRQKALIVFVVDASDSMGEGTLERMKAAKGAILGWLLTAYQQRDQVALVAFRGRRAEVLLPPTAGISLARRRLRELPVGGATPLADGLSKAWQVVRMARRKQPRIRPLVVVVSDGEANVPLVAGNDVNSEILTLAGGLARERVQTLIVDSSTAAGGNRTLRRLARELDGRYRHIRDLHAGRLMELIRDNEKRGGNETMGRSGN